MKKVIFKNGLRAFLATCCFLVLGVVGVNAQSQIVGSVVPGIVTPSNIPNTPLYTAPAGAFHTGASAITILNAELAQLKDEMIMNQNDPAVFNALLSKYHYFAKIAEYITAGATTPNAIVAGLWIFLQDSAVAVVSPATQQLLKAEAVALLQL